MPCPSPEMAHARAMKRKTPMTIGAEPRLNSRPKLSTSIGPRTVLGNGPSKRAMSAPRGTPTAAAIGLTVTATDSSR
jgi:hypothetical protein